MLAREIMSSPVVTVRSDDTVRAAAERLLRGGYASAPVVDDDVLVGIVSELDIVRARAAHDPRSRVRPEAPVAEDPPMFVGDVMTRTVITASPTDDTVDLAGLMARRGVRAVPVVDQDRVVGMISRRDVLRALERADASVLADVEHRLREFDSTEPAAGAAGPAQSRWRVAVVDGVVTVAGPVADDREAAVLRLLVRTVPGVVRVHLLPTGPGPAAAT